jgi:NAD+ synthase
VLGSSDKSEFNIGYFTKFGDGSADILPIISLYKTQIRELAKFLGIPKSIIAKKSSPNLWKNHFAEDEIGATYEEIDLVLHCLLDKKMNMNEIIQTTELQESKINKILTLHKNSEHKRKQPMKIIEDN